jgi:hypothetical protein
MNWYLAVGTVSVVSILMWGFIRDAAKREKDQEFPLQKMRKHLGIVPQGAPKDWTESWVDGEDKPLKVQPLLPPKQETGPVEIAYLESLLGPTGDQHAAFLRGIEQASRDRAAALGWESDEEHARRTAGHRRLQ